MRFKNLKSALINAGVTASVLLASAAAHAQTVSAVNLTAGAASVAMPDGSTVPMWGYSCTGTATNNASCAALDPAATAPGAWSPVIITVPTGNDLQINLTNTLSFGANNIPTSLVVVGQLGGGLGSAATYTASPDHSNAQPLTWPIANTDPGQPAQGLNPPPAQGQRVQSFATEVLPGSTPTALCWGVCGQANGQALRPGTYLIESGTHPSIQGPMGLYGILVVTSAPNGSAAGTAYGSGASAVRYNAEVPALFSEIDPIQNTAVDAAVRTAGFAETGVFAGFTGTNNQSTLCRAADGVSPAPAACYPPAVNYTPLFYLINGVAFNKNSPSASLFATTPASNVTGTVLVRLVNAGLRMHVPSIVGSQTGSAASGFALIAEDGNALPGVPRVQSEVFMAAGKTYDVLINAPPVPTAGTSVNALPIFDRELSLSANSMVRDAGMLAYLSINGAGVPNVPALATAKANPDTYNSVISGQTLVVADPSKGVLANDVNVTGAQVSGIAPAGLTLNLDGTFSYSGGVATSFNYCGNGGSACATVQLGLATLESATGIAMGPSSYTSPNGPIASQPAKLFVNPPGVLVADSDGAGYPLVVDMSTVTQPAAGATVSMNADGSFTATATAAGTYTFQYKAKNSQGTTSQNTATVTLVFPTATGPLVTVLDGKDVFNHAANVTTVTDYRWVIEEDRTFYVDPNCTTNPPQAGCPGANIAGTNTNGVVVNFGTNFHTSHMPVVATGCTGPLSCESGQTILDTGTPCTSPGVPAGCSTTAGQHVAAVCDIGDGVCRVDPTGAGLIPVDPSQVHLDPTKRYYISVLPGDAANPFENGNLTADCTNGVAAASNPGTCGHGMGGAPIPASCQPTYPATTCSTSTPAAVTVLSEPAPYPPSKLSVFVFEDDFPLNGEQDAGGGVDVLSPNEPGLGGFNITLYDDAGGTGDATGQMTYDMFNQPLSNSLAGTIDPTTGKDACPISVNPRNPSDPTSTGLTGTIVTCPKFESDGKTLSPLAGQAVIANLMPGRFGVVATEGADRISRGEEWLQTNTLDGQKAHDSFLRIGEPSFFQEYGPAGFHVSIGFANPAIINARKAGICNGQDPNSPQPGTPYTCGNTVTGTVSTERMSRTPDERLYGSGDNTGFAFTQCYVSVGDADGEDFAFTKCDANGNFKLTSLPEGDWRVTVFDQWNDMLVDGLSTPVRLGATSSNCPGSTSSANNCDLGELAINQWQSNIYTRTFLDQAGTGVATDYSGTQCTSPGVPAGCNANYGNAQPGLTLVVTNNRYRDGSFSNFNNTDLAGNAGFNEIFPLFNWYVIETDTTRFKNTGTHVVYDSGGPSDGSPECQPGVTQPCNTQPTATAGFLANTVEQVSLPVNLRVPGAVYCAGADCQGKSIAAGPASSDAPTSGCSLNASGQNVCSNYLSTGRIDPPWVNTEGWQGFSGENEFVEFGKTPFAPGENGGIHGHVVYASTRPFDDPQLLLQNQWEPQVPGVTINLYQVGTAPDGSQSLTLVDTTKTSSWDDWAQGFRSDGIPNMNCPGQVGSPTASTAGDLFFFSLFNQPNYLDLYSKQHATPDAFDATATGTPLPNNAQFKCYDGMHNWNQVQPAPYDGAYQFPSVAARDPVSGKPVGGTNPHVPGTYCSVCVADPTDGTPMLPNGKYVVEVVVPPGFELVKEEDKNILIGDNFIIPATVQFPNLATAVYILPDQAELAAQYNANSVQNPTQNLGRIPNLPSHEGDTGSVESYWPCVGAERIVPDYISLYPGSHEVAPFAGAKRNLCDRKLVELDDQTSVLTKFYVFTSTHVAAHFAGVITDDYTSEFDPYSPQFGEKFSPANLPVAIKDWSGAEIGRVYADHWGAYNGLTYSTWEVNPPNPTGYSPSMMVFCMNDAGTGATPDPLYQPAYAQFCYELPFMPGQTAYLDTPVVPTSAFAGAGYNNPDCSYPDSTPAVSEVDGDAVGPYLSSGGNRTLTIYAMGDTPVTNYAYSGPSATKAPYNAKNLTRHYGFGGTAGTVALVGADGVAHNLTVSSGNWTDLKITATVPAIAGMNCAVQQQQQYGGPSQNAPAQCGELVITAANGKQSIDAVTVTIGGKAPKHIAVTDSIQTAIDAAAPGDLLMVDPATPASVAGGKVTYAAAVHQELLLMWKPVRLQGVGAVSSIISASTHPAGKLDAWRREVNCLFGLAINGQPFPTASGKANAYDTDNQGYVCPSVAGTTPLSGAAAANDANFSGAPVTLNYFSGRADNPQIDRLPLEAVVGWDASQNGNLAELLQEPSLMGALEGAGITVLAKGMEFPSNADPFGLGAANAGTFPTGTILLNGGTNNNRPRGFDTTASCGRSDPNAVNPYPSNFYCNPSSIDGLTITNSSQGGGGVFVHGWAHNLQIANNRVTNNAGTLSGGINVGQGEFPPNYTVGGTNADPGSCQDNDGLPTGTELQYCFNVNINMHHNAVTRNSSTGDELFSATPAGAGGVSICNGSDYYKFNYNWVCGNLSTGDGGGIAHIGFSYDGDIEHNTIVFNQSTNPTIPTNGGGLLVMGAPDSDPTCGAITDVDCLSNPPVAPADGAGPGLVINANLILGNAAESGSGGGLRLQNVNGTDVITFPNAPTTRGGRDNWYHVMVTNNIIADNVAGWDGAGVSLQDALYVDLINNTVASNDTTASSGVLFDTVGAPLASAHGTNCKTSATSSCAQPAGIVAVQSSTNLLKNLPNGTLRCPAGHFQPGTSQTGTAAHPPTCLTVSYPELYNNVVWQNRAFYIGVGNLGLGTINQQNVVALFNAFGPTTTANQVATQSTTDATTANGGGAIVTGGTGACVANTQYWEIGVRGDTGPSNHDSTVTLAPQYSVLTDAADYPQLNNSAGNPTFVQQYCNGSRTPPEFQSLGYLVPPGISDATVPNPLFNLTPVATVDEGNNWINISWGPLTLANVSDGTNTGKTLGNYGPAAGSAAIDYIAPGASTYGAAPKTDFYGTARKTAANPIVDAGAVEFVGAAGAVAKLTVTPSSLAFGNQRVGTTSGTQNLTLANSGTAAATGISINVSAPFTRVNSGGFPNGAPNCNATLAAGASCTIKVVFAPSALGAANGTASITASVAVTNAPVPLTGTGTGGRLVFAAATNGSIATGLFGIPTLTFTIPNPRAAVTSTVTISNTGTDLLALSADTLFMNFSGTFSIVAPAASATPTCVFSNNSTLAVGASCNVGLRYATPRTAPRNANGALFNVTNNGIGTFAGVSALGLSAQ